MTDDQKRALGLGAIGLVGLVAFTRMRGRSSGPNITPISSSGSTQPYTPQAPLPLVAGESVYDPNSQALLNTPAALDNSPGPGNGSQSQAPSAPAYTVNVNYPKPVTSKPTTKKPTKRPVKKRPVKVPKSTKKAAKK